MFYRDIQGGGFDELPLPLACAPHVVKHLMPEMLNEYIKDGNADMLVALTGLRDSIIHDWLCALTELTHYELVLSTRSACLVVPDIAADTERVYPFDIPEWLMQVNELVPLDWRPGGLMTLKQLRAHLIREVQNSTCNIGNCLYRG